MITLRNIMMHFRNCTSTQNMRVLFLGIVFIAQTCGLQFFTIYLKYLNFSAIQVGIIRASQTWISMLLNPAWLFITKRLQSIRRKKFVIFMFLVVIIALHLCLTFLPQSSTLQDVTHCQKHTSHPLKEKQLKHHADKEYDHFKPMLQVPSHTANVTVIKTMSSPLNRTLPKINSEHNELILHEKSVPQNVSIDEVQDVSIEQTPIPVLDKDETYHSSEVFPQKTNNVAGHNTPIHKTWHFRRHSSQYEPWNAYSNKKIHNLKHSEEGKVPNILERNKAEDVKFHETWVPKHADIPSVQHKNVRKYYAQDSSFSGSHITSKRRNLEDSFSDEQSTSRLQEDIVEGMGDPVESAQESENQINISSKRKHQDLPQLLIRYKSGRKMKEAGHKEVSLPISGEVTNLLGARMIHKNMKQDKEFDPQERHLRRKHVPKSKASKSQEEEEEFSKNVMNELIIQQPVQHTVKHYDKNNKIHKRDVTSQTLKYNETRETNIEFSMQDTIRELMNVTSSESGHNDTDLQVEKIIMPRSDKNTSMHLWNIAVIKKLPDYSSTTFIVVLILSILVCVFYRAIATTMNQILQCEETVLASSNMPLTSSYQHVLTLMAWGVCGCLILPIFVLAAQCSYQPKVFLLFSAGLFVINLLIIFMLQLPERRLHWMPWGSENKGERGQTSFLQKFGYGVSIFFTSFAMACNLEYILWHIETLHGFSYNYQLLYGSYVAIAAFTEALITLWMQKKHLYDQDNTDSGCQNTLNAAEDGVWGIGIFLLGLHFLAASFLHSAWQTVFLGIIQGCSAAIFTTRTTSGWWALGYGIGSLVGGIVVEDSGTHWLFWVIAISILFWSQIIIVCKGDATIIVPSYIVPSFQVKL